MTPSDSKMASGVTFESLLGHFGVGLPESLLSHFWVTLILSGFCRLRSTLTAQRSLVTDFRIPARLLKLVGELIERFFPGKFSAGNLAGTFLTHEIKAQEKFGAFFVRKFIAKKYISCQNSLCKSATLMTSELHPHCPPIKTIANAIP